MQKKITPFLWFNGQAEEAMKFYTSVFKEAKILNVTKIGDDIVTGSFELFGQEFMVLDGGPHFKFNEAVSFFVKCKDQQEVDYYWNQLLSGGGQEQMCGWLKDKFGLSWQIIPDALGQLMHTKDQKKSQAVMQAMLKMRKIEVSLLQEAYDKN